MGTHHKANRFVVNAADEPRQGFCLGLPNLFRTQIDDHAHKFVGADSLEIFRIESLDEEASFVRRNGECMLPENAIAQFFSTDFTFIISIK